MYDILDQYSTRSFGFETFCDEPTNIYFPVSAAELQKAITDHPEVKRCVVVPGSRPFRAYVVLKGSADRQTAQNTMQNIIKVTAAKLRSTHGTLVQLTHVPLLLCNADLKDFVVRFEAIKGLAKL
ncbi:hypothetical protein DSO57_1016265 [Entomophthora muscae]|uniref:Uncharacterized protein n=1 Tax=Entomophthora muscae TaxID=34485 RepID=A0ACC2TS42_9FUNG|nr:hypothetical protein DSO57_1016265 [Entomophthora muscae]